MSPYFLTLYVSKRNRFEETKGFFLARHQDNVFSPLYFYISTLPNEDI